MSKTIHIACATNQKYHQHCLAMIASVCANTNTPSDLFFYVGFKGENANFADKEFKILMQKYGCQIEKIVIENSRFEKLQTSQHKTSDAYSKIFLPKLITSSTQRLIYLDSDIIVLSDIRELWNYDLKGMVIGAVRDTFYEEVVNRKPLFNSGVLLFDIVEYISEEIEEKVVAEIIKDKPTDYWLADQDELNEVLKGKWHILPSVWNVASTDLARKNAQSKNPKLIHFTGSNVLKPDHYLCDNPYKKKYFTYLKVTTQVNGVLPLIPAWLSHVLRVGSFYLKKLIRKPQ